MKMIAATKLQKAQRARSASVPYNNGLQEILRHLSSLSGESNEVLLTGYKEVKNIHVILFTSDRGLCGSYNSNAIKKAVTLADKAKNSQQKVTFSFIGRRGHDYFCRHGYESVHFYNDCNRKPSFDGVDIISRDMINEFSSEKYHEVWMVYGEFVSALSQRPVAELLLPMRGREYGRPQGRRPARHANARLDYIIEPSAEELLQIMLPKFIKFQIYHALLEAVASEHGARMTAMDGATKNSIELLDRYTLLRNRARQAAITKELIEIVAGKEAAG